MKVGSKAKNETSKDESKGKGNEAAEASTPNDGASVATSQLPPLSSTSSQVEAASSATNMTPSVTVDTTESSNAHGTLATPSDSMLSPPRARSRAPSDASQGDRESSPNLMTLEDALDTSRGIGRIINTGVKSPLNFTMGLARGFRNAPRLYNDDTIRPEERVTGFRSGLKVAGKEFGLGFYDGLSGLVMHPIKGAEKEGGIGLLKGVGKGIGGLILKPAAGVWSIPAYTMQGVHAEVRNLFGRSSINYIISSRVVEGRQQLETATVEEQKDIIARWQTHRWELKAFYKVQESSKDKHDDKSHAGDDSADAPPKTGWLHTRHLTFEERKKLQEEKEAWQKRRALQQAAGLYSSSGSSLSVVEDEEMEHAILASVRQTSRGNPKEDAKVEEAIRASVREMQRIAKQSREVGGSSSAIASSLPSDDDIRNVTDEEYQALIEEAVKQSLVAEQMRQSQQEDPEQDEDLRRAIEQSRMADRSGPGGEAGTRQGQHVDPEHDEDLQRAIEQSRLAHEATPGSQDDQEAEIRRIMDQSEKEHLEKLNQQKTEEEMVLEYVKKQSLAEEEFRRSKLKGKAVGTRQPDGDQDEDDEDLKRALEESLHMSGHGSAGPSSTSK